MNLSLCLNVASLLKKLQDFFAISIGEVPGLALWVEVLDKSRREGLLDVTVVVVDLGRLAIATNLLTVAVRVTDLHAPILKKS